MVAWGRRERLVAACASGAGLVAAGLIYYAVVIEPRRIVVERVCAPVRDLGPELDGLTLVQLSDLHCSAGRKWAAHLNRAVQMINDLRPDLIVLTGDFVDDTTIVAECAAILAGLKAPLGVIAVLGNHDYYGSPLRPRLLLSALRDAGILVLRNDVHEVAANKQLQLVGLDDPYTGHDKLAVALERLPRQRGTRILLSHYPDVVERLAPGTVDLVLSGHAHGGQIHLPGLSRLAIRHHARTGYSHGLYDVDGTPLYVSRGLGTSWPWARFLMPPEIAHITLVARRQ